ncbi:MAG: hypothetical protein ABR616_18180 [Dermatophilaceae bacterium]|nr:hypothetical protein [Intrasporangiaceae bacterium]
MVPGGSEARPFTHRQRRLRIRILRAVRGHQPRQALPVFPGNENDQAIIRTVKDDLGAWRLSRLVWVCTSTPATPVAGAGGEDEGARTQRFVVCHNPEQAQRDQVVRANLIEHLLNLIEHSDTWSARSRCA